MQLKKLKFRLESWKSTVYLPQSYENVASIKIRYLLYTTANAGNEDLTISCNDFKASGYLINADGSNADYFFSTPLDTTANVTCLSANYTGEMDITFDNPIRSINQFTLECLINNLPTNDITTLNPVVIEMGFYSF